MSDSKSNLYDPKEKMNTVLYTGTDEWNTYEGFQRKNELWEDRVGSQGHKARRADELPADIGDAPHTDTEPPAAGWVLPPSFCAVCGKTDVTDSVGLDGTVRRPVPNVVLVDEPRPDIDLAPGEVVFCFTCPSCAWASRYGGSNKPQLVDLDGNPLVSEDKTPEGRLFDYIRSMKLRGERKIFAHEVNFSKI